MEQKDVRNSEPKCPCCGWGYVKKEDASNKLASPFKSWRFGFGCEVYECPACNEFLKASTFTEDGEPLGFSVLSVKALVEIVKCENDKIRDGYYPNVETLKNFIKKLDKIGVNVLSLE